MLKEFKVREEDAVRVKEGPLRATVTAIFEKMGVPPEDAAIAADVIVTADIRGVDSHGVSNMLRSYVAGYTNGNLNPRPNWRIVREAPSTANIDCDGGLGIILCPKAMNIAIEKAKKTGVGMVTMHNGRHMGMAAYYPLMAIKHDMIGLAMTACGPSVLPTFGRETRIGTNPIAFAAPAKSEPPFVFDAAMSSVANNKLGLARRLGTLLPPGLVGDKDGVPIMQPIIPDPSAPLLPLGSTRELGSHKGYALSCMVEILGGVLAAAKWPMARGRGKNDHFLAAINIAAFIDVDEFKEAMDEFLRSLKNCPPAKGQERVLYAGLPEWEYEQDRRANGIPLHREVIQWFSTICAELGVPMPV